MLDTTRVPPTNKQRKAARVRATPTHAPQLPKQAPKRKRDKKKKRKQKQARRRRFPQFPFSDFFFIFPSPPPSVTLRPGVPIAFESKINHSLSTRGSGAWNTKANSGAAARDTLGDVSRPRRERRKPTPFPSAFLSVSHPNDRSFRNPKNTDSEWEYMMHCFPKHPPPPLPERLTQPSCTTKWQGIFSIINRGSS